MKRFPKKLDIQRDRGRWLTMWKRQARSYIPSSRMNGRVARRGYSVIARRQAEAKGKNLATLTFKVVP